MPIFHSLYGHLGQTGNKSPVTLASNDHHTYSKGMQPSGIGEAKGSFYTCTNVCEWRLPECASLAGNKVHYGESLEFTVCYESKGLNQAYACVHILCSLGFKEHKLFFVCLKMDFQPRQDIKCTFQMVKCFCKG